MNQNDQHENPRSTAAVNPRSTAAVNPRSTAAVNPRSTAAVNPRGTASPKADSAARTAHSIGIEVYGGCAIVLIPAGSRTPVARAMTFTTVADGQRAVEVRVVRCVAEGPARPQAAGSASRHLAAARPSGVVGRFLVSGLRTGRRGEARIDIGISLDREGVIRAWGADRSSGARQEATYAGFWVLAPKARPRALSALARRVDAELAGPEFEDIPALRNEGVLLRGLAGQGFDGPALAALAGEIDSVRRSTAEPPVRLR